MTILRFFYVEKAFVADALCAAMLYIYSTTAHEVLLVRQVQVKTLLRVSDLSSHCVLTHVTFIFIARNVPCRGHPCLCPWKARLKVLIS